MKLLLIYMTLLSLCLLIGPGGERISSQEEVKSEVLMPLSQESVDCPTIVAESHWLRTYYMMLKVLNPVKQLDLPSDYKSWNGIPCKSLSSSHKSYAPIPLQESHAAKFMRFLSARHSDGFYIYSLRKLII